MSLVLNAFAWRWQACRLEMATIRRPWIAPDGMLKEFVDLWPGRLHGLLQK
jgi:hypothetical protein